MTDSTEKDIKYKRLIELVDQVQKGIDKETPLEEMDPLLEKYVNQAKNTKDSAKNSPITPIANRIDSLNKMLELYRGKKYIGLCVTTIKEFNEKLKGLRKLILLAAPPTAGKTAITTQLGIEALIEDKDACLLYVSLEMTADEIFTRMNLYLSGLDYNTFVLGNEQTEDKDGKKQSLFTNEEQSKIAGATKKLEDIGDRLQIIDSSSHPHISSEGVIKYIEQIEKETQCARVIVIIDYLQVWPSEIKDEIQADKWRIGEMKKIKEAINKDNQNPVIVISEMRKPPKDSVWGGDLSDVMGSARGTYTPDVVILCHPLTETVLKKIFEEKKILKPPIKEETKESTISSFLAEHGISILKLIVPKCRDGMKRFNVLITFHIYKNTFTYVDWEHIKSLVGEVAYVNKSNNSTNLGRGETLI